MSSASNAPSPARELSSAGRATRIAIVGLAAGFLSGLFGVGGGILMVPALVLLLGFDQRHAHGTSLAAILPIAASGLVGYVVDDNVDWSVAGTLVVGALVGTVLGVKLLHALSHRALGYAFAGLLLATAVRLFVDNSSATGRGDLTVGAVVALVVIGVASGVLAGLLGVGGGIVMVPAMVIFFHVAGAVAKGTSIAVIIPVSIMGTWRNRKRKNADIRTAALVGGAGAVSAFAGARIADGMDETLSNVLFATLLVVVAARMLFQLQKERRAEPVPAPLD